MIKRRNRRKQTVSFDERLEHAARTAHEAAGTLPEGPEREIMLTKARQAETARRINGWLASTGLQAPK